MANLKNFNTLFAGIATNIDSDITEEQFKSGIENKSEISSYKLNTALNSTDVFMKEFKTNGLLQYDPSQIYPTGSQVAIYNNFNKIYFFRATGENVANKPPVTGTIQTYVGGDQYYTAITKEGQNNWKKILIDTHYYKSIEVTEANQRIQLFSNPTIIPNGVIKVKIYKSDTLHCSFDLVFRNSLDYYQIKNVNYSRAVKNGGQVGTQFILFPGFCMLFDKNPRLGLTKFEDNDKGNTIINRSYYNQNTLSLFFEKITYVDKVVFDLGEFNQDIDFQVIRESNVEIKFPMAIIEDGGSVIKDIFKLSNYPAPIKTYDFNLFSQGLIQWNGALNVTSNYYWQFIQYGAFLDPRNNEDEKVKSYYNLYIEYIPIEGNVLQITQSNISGSGAFGTTGTSFAPVVKGTSLGDTTFVNNVVTNETTVPYGALYRTTNSYSIPVDVNRNTWSIVMDASLSSGFYKNDVEGITAKSLVVNFMIKAF